MKKILKNVSFIFLCSGLYHFIFGLFIWLSKRQDYKLHSLKEFIEANHRWDVDWYINIANQGYWIDPSRNDQSVAFFPLFPFSIKAFSLLLGREVVASDVPYIFQRIICLIMTLILPIWIIKTFQEGTFSFLQDWSKETKLTCLGFIMFFAIHPAMVFFLFSYTEALFFVLMIPIFLIMMQKENSWKQLIPLFILCFLLSLSRPTGLFLGPASVLSGLVYYKQKTLQTEWKKLLVLCFGTLSAFIFFSGFLYYVVGQPFSFISARSAGWNEHPSLINVFKLLIPYRSQDLLRCIIVYLALGGTFLLYRKKKIFEFFVCFIFLLLPMIQGKVGDMVRYSVVCLPAWFELYLYIRKKEVLLIGVTNIFTLGAIYNLFCWLQGKWVG